MDTEAPKSHPVRLAWKCPACDQQWFFDPEIHVEMLEGSTTDCDSCGALLVFSKLRVYLFHEWMHAQGPTTLPDGSTWRWPKDGHNTGYIEI